MNIVKDIYQYRNFSDCRKNYKVIEEFLKICYDDEKEIPHLEQMIQRIRNL